MVASRLTIGTQQKAPRRTIDSGFSARPSHGSGCRAVAQARPTCQSRPSGSDQTDARTAFGGPNESKQNQINPRKKAWFSLDSLGRFGAFQWVTANPNKKIPAIVLGLSASSIESIPPLIFRFASGPTIADVRFREWLSLYHRFRL